MKKIIAVFLLRGLILWFCALNCSAADYDIVVESPVAHAIATPAIGYKFVGAGWSTAAKRCARKAMSGIPESPSGEINLYWVFPTTTETNYLQLYPWYKSILWLIVDSNANTVLEADFYINRRKARLCEIQKLIAKMRARIGL